MSPKLPSIGVFVFPLSGGDLVPRFPRIAVQQPVVTPDKLDSAATSEEGRFE